MSDLASSPEPGSFQMGSCGTTDDGFRGPQVCSIVGITYRQLDYWARTDLVRPSLHDAAGSGTQRLYSYRDLVELKVVKSLIDSGVSLQASRRAIEYLRQNLDEELASAHLVIQGANSILAYSGDAVIDLLRNGQGVLNIVALGPVVESIDDRIIELNPATNVGAGIARSVSVRSSGQRRLKPPVWTGSKVIFRILFPQRSMGLEPMSVAYKACLKPR